MTISFKFYHDSALTQEITAGNPLTATQDTAGLLPVVDKTIYLGSTIIGNKAQVQASPGIAAIEVSVADANGATGAPVTEFKLATSAVGLDSAVAGAALTLAVTINSGVANAVPIYTRRDSALAVAGSYTDLSLVTQTLIETPV
ncbi:MAG: hypothetical protein ABS92_06805 [Thiobacillus sp. SCN 63-374]|nr:MAG: hypothetical protein ABS92_06805 [Thiobacillus sp. SCN 63-374]